MLSGLRSLLQPRPSRRARQSRPAGMVSARVVLADSPATPTRWREWQSAEAHASALWRWLRTKNLVDGAILARDLKELHREMCAELGWMPRKWNPVGHALALLTTGGRKIYAHVGDQRLRIYPLPRSKRSAERRSAERREHTEKNKKASSLCEPPHRSSDGAQPKRGPQISMPQSHITNQRNGQARPPLIWRRHAVWSTTQ